MKRSSNQWWHHCSAIWRYMPGEDGKSISDIIADLKEISASGYQAVQITAPYASAGFYPWWGLRPLNYFSVNKVLDGTMEDFAKLICKCHEYDLKVLVFLNIGYADVTSPLWKKACYDKRNSICSKERNLFLWSDSEQQPLTQQAGTHFLQGGYWHWNEDAQSYYWCHWNKGGFAEPQYNWESADTGAFIESILEHWLSAGVDGVIVDAVNWYLNCSMEKIRRHVTDVIHRYPNVICIPEGGTGFGDAFLPWITEGGFDIIEDQTFHSDLHWNGSGIMETLKTQNPHILDKALKVCNEARNRNIMCWSYLSWGNAWTAEYRLMEIAVLVATGHITEIIPSYLNNFQETHRNILKRLLRVTCLDAISPVRRRTRIMLNKNTSCYAVLCDSEEKPVLCIFNLSKKEQNIDVSKGLYSYSMWEDKISGSTATAKDNCLQISLAGLGFAFLVPVI